MDKEQNKFNKEIGQRIRDHREFLSYTREQLAEKCDISSQFLADIEVGRKSMTARTLRNISKSLNLSADYILNGTSSGRIQPLRKRLRPGYVKSIYKSVTEKNF